jgi:hypothetical protein
MSRAPSWNNPQILSIPWRIATATGRNLGAKRNDLFDRPTYPSTDPKPEIRQIREGAITSTSGTFGAGGNSFAEWLRRELLPRLLSA